MLFIYYNFLSWKVWKYFSLPYVLFYLAVSELYFCLEDYCRKRFWKDDGVGRTRNLTPNPDNILNGRMFHITMLELWSLLKAYNFYGNAYTLNEVNFWTISALSSVRITPCLLAQWLAAMYLFLEQTACRVGNKGPVLQISGICALITDCCFW